ncbi:MAG TPA: YihY/virulence factor BrkB family protein [Acidimicrobiales bacterium]|nr:YihY/virulence factor BrkB family protein [Acidimicrobiales bacterium]
MSNVIDAALRRVDRFQRSHRVPAFAFGVVKKYGDDRGGSLAALVTYYSFLSLFPLLLVLVTVLGIVVGSGSSLAAKVQGSALSKFPVIGPQLSGHIGTLHGSPLALTIGLLGLVWGSLGASQAGQYAMAQVWNVPLVERPGFLPRLARSVMLLGVLGFFLVVSTALSGYTAFSGHQSLLARVGSALLNTVVDVGLFSTSFRILTPADVSTRELLPGAVLGGVAWTGLLLGGIALVGHELRHVSQTYSVFATVLGLLWWLYLSAQVVLYATEVNVVRSRHLWPRSLVQPPLTPADRRMLTAYAAEQRRRPDVRVSVGFDPPIEGEA